MIRIICGTCGTSKGYKNETDGALTLPAAEERRLVARGVAEYVTRPIISPAHDADSHVDGGDGGGTGNNPPDPDTPLEGLEIDGRDTSIGYQVKAEDSTGITDGYVDRELLLQMTRNDLDQLAVGFGLNVSKCRNKGDVVDLLTAFYTAANNEAPPNLEPEAPVV